MVDLASISLPLLCATAFALGARHALDADHLTVIDGIARRNVVARPFVAQAGGVLFSIGHAAVVAIVALVAMRLAGDVAQPPAWLATTGVVISGSILLLLGGLNLRAAWATPAGEHARPVGWRARLGGRGNHPLAIIATGALFALSFDTIAIALGVGLAGKALGGWPAVLAGAGGFAAGMALVGGINGAWVVRLLRSASRHARAASRIMTAAIGLLNLALGGLAFVALMSGPVDAWKDRHGLLISALVVAGCALAFAIGIRLAMRRGDEAGGAFELGVARR